MEKKSRNMLALGSSLCLCFILAIGMFDMPAAGATISEYGRLLTNIALEERHSINTISGVLFDLRAMDSLGELLVIFTASAGLNIMLRKYSDENEIENQGWCASSRQQIPVGDAVRTVGFAFVIVTAIIGIYLTVRGHLTVGGGFQGGVIIASGLILFYLSGRFDIQKEVGNTYVLELADSIGMAGYVIIGLAGLSITGIFLSNIFPIGNIGELFSAGMIPILSILVGMEAFAAVSQIVTQIQSQLHNREGGYE